MATTVDILCRACSAKGKVQLTELSIDLPKGWRIVLTAHGRLSYACADACARRITKKRLEMVELLEKNISAIKIADADGSEQVAAMFRLEQLDTEEYYRVLVQKTKLGLHPGPVGTLPSDDEDS